MNSEQCAPAPGALELVEIGLEMNGRAWQLHADGNTAGAAALWEFVPRLMDLIEPKD